MAPESILERIYTSASDVWSFGIFSWEVFALGQTPYPGIGTDEVIMAISRGYRMTRPDLCPPEVLEWRTRTLIDADPIICRFDVLNRCWMNESAQRPSFSWILSTMRDVCQEESRL